MNLDNQLKIQNPFKKESQNINQNNNGDNFLFTPNNNNQNIDDTYNFHNNELNQNSGYNEDNSQPNQNDFNQEADSQEIQNLDANQQYINQHLMDYQPGMLDEQDGQLNQYQNGMIYYDQGDKNQDYENILNFSLAKINQTEQYLDKYEKVTEYLLQADKHSLNGIRNTLNYQQNKNFFYQEKCCLEILHQNNQIFNFEAYKCVMIMCGILLDASISLIKEKRYYLAEKYLLRAKYLTEPNEKHLRKKNQRKLRKQLMDEEHNQNNTEEKKNNESENSQIQQQSSYDEEDDNNEQDDFDTIFEQDLRYHDIRIEIALNLCDVYKQQMKIIKKKKKNQQKKKSIQSSSQAFDSGNKKYDFAGNEIAGMKEIKEEHELELEHEKFDKLNASPPIQSSANASPNKEKQVFFAPSPIQSTVALSRNVGQTSLKNIKDDDIQKQDIDQNKESYQQLLLRQKQKEMDEEEEKDEEEKINENKLENAMQILNDIESKLTDEYIEQSKQDLKGTLCKFYAKKVEVLAELLKHGEDQYEEQEIKEMSQELLECAHFVIARLESILLPLKANDSPESQEDQVYLAIILSYTWTKLGKYRLKTQEIEKAKQCYKNAYEKLVNFFKEGQDRMMLQYKFKRKYDKLIGKLEFEKIDEAEIIEFSQFQQEYANNENHKKQMKAAKKNYLASKKGIPMSDIQSPSVQFYIDPEYLNQLQNHHTVKSLNKNRYLKKIPISHPFGSSLTDYAQQSNSQIQKQPNSNQQGQQQEGRQFKFKKNLQLQLENYKSQILGSNSTSLMNQQPFNANQQSHADEYFKLPKSVAGKQIELSPEEKSIPFLVPTKKIRQHPQSAKARGSSSSRAKNYDNNSQLANEQNYFSNTNLSNQEYMQPTANKFHRKAPSFANTLTKISSQSTKNLYSNNNNDDIYQKNNNPDQLQKNFLSYTTVASKKNSQGDFKFNQEETQSQVPHSVFSYQQKSLSSKGNNYYKKNEEENTYQSSLEYQKQLGGGVGSQTKDEKNNQSQQFMPVSNSKKLSLHQYPQHQGIYSGKRIASAKNLTQNTNIQNKQIQSIEAYNQTAIQQPPFQNNLIDPSNTSRSKLENAKTIRKPMTRINSQNDILESIMNFVDQINEGNNNKNSFAHSNKSTTISTSHRKAFSSSRPSSSIIYFSTNRLFNNNNPSQSVHQQYQLPQQQVYQQGVIYEGNEIQDISKQVTNEEKQQLQFLEQSSQDQQNLQKAVEQIKKPLEGNKFLIINQRPTKNAKNVEKIIDTMGNLRVQLNNLFDTSNQLKTLSNKPSTNSQKITLKLTKDQDQQFMNIICNRPSLKTDQGQVNTKKQINSSRKMSSQQQIQAQQYNIQKNNQPSQIAEEEYYNNSNNQLQTKNGQSGGKQSYRNSIKAPQQMQASQQQYKSLTQFDDNNKKVQSVRQLQQDRKNEGSQKRLNTIEKQNSRIKDVSQLYSQQPNQQLQQQVGSSAFIQINQNQSNNNNPSYNSVNVNQYIAHSSQQVKIPQGGSPKAKDKEIQMETNRNITNINNTIILKRKNTEIFHDASQISAQPLFIQQNQISNQENSRLLKQSKQGDQILANKSGFVNNSKIEDKQITKPATIRRLSTNINESVFKRQSTANYEQIQIDIQTNQQNNEEEKRFNSQFTTPFLKQKFDQFENMNNDRINKDQNKINETQSSQEDEDEDSKLEDSDDQQRNVPNQMLDDLQNNQIDELKGGDENFNGDDLKKSDKRLGNSMNLKVSIVGGTLGKLNQQSPDISRLLSSQQGQLDVNKSYGQHLHVTDQGISSLQQSFNQQIQNNIQSNYGAQDKSTMINNSQNIANALIGNTKGMNVSQNLKQQIGIQNRDQFPVKTIYFPSIKQSKYLFVQNRIQELLFAPLYFYKSYNQYSLCQWNVTNITIELENVTAQEDAEDIEQVLKGNSKDYKQNQGGLPFTSDKIRYDIKLCIFLECIITDQHIISNPLIFYLKNQPLNFIDHLWPNDKSKIETKYELAILLLDRWIRERDLDAVEEFYNIGLSMQNIQVQFVLRGGNSFLDFQNLIQKEQSQSETIQNDQNFDQIRVFGLKLNFIINKIAQVMKKVHGDVLKLPTDLNDIINPQLNIRQNNLKSLRSHQNKRRELKNYISYYNIDQYIVGQIQQLQTYKKKKVNLQISDSINQKQDGVTREKGHTFNEHNVKKQNSNVDLQIEIDYQQNGYQRIPLNREGSNESPIFQKNTDTNELSDFQLQKRLSLNNMNSYQQNPTNSSNSNSQNQSKIPFYGPQQPFQLQLQQSQPSINTPAFSGRFSQKKLNIINPSIHSIQSQGSGKIQVNTSQSSARFQKYQYLKYKMKERVYQVQKESETSIPLETQVNFDLGKNQNQLSPTLPVNSLSGNIPDGEGTQESLIQNNNQNQIVQNGKFETEYSSPRQNQKNSKIIIPNILMQGFSSVVEDQGAGVSPKQSKDISNEEQNLLLQKDAQLQAEEYKKKYEITTQSVPNTNNNTPQAVNIHSLMIHQNSFNKQNNLRIEHLKRQIRDSLQSQQQNSSNLNDNSQSYSESPRSFIGNSSQNNSFANSSYNSSATSPTNLVGQNTLQRMPSMLSNKSSKSKFSRYAPVNNEELNDSIQSPSQALIPQNKKSSQFAKQNMKFDIIDDDSQKTPIMSQQQSESVEYFPTNNNEEAVQVSSYKFVFNDQPIINQKQEKPEIIVKEYDVAEDKSEEIIQKTEENEEFIQNKIINNAICGDPFVGLPDTYQYTTFTLNPFINNDLLLKTVIKRDKLFFFVQLFYTFEPQLEQYIYYQQALAHSYFILKVDSMIYKNGWDSEIILTFEQVIEKLILPYTSFSFFKFLYAKGFTAKQKDSIKKGLEKYLQVKDCQFIINWEYSTEKIQTKHNINDSQIQNKPLNEDEQLTNDINDEDKNNDSIIINKNKDNDYQQDNSNQNNPIQLQIEQNVQNNVGTQKSSQEQGIQNKKKKLQFSDEVQQDYQNEQEKVISYYQQQLILQNQSQQELNQIIDGTKYDYKLKNKNLSALELGLLGVNTIQSEKQTTTAYQSISGNIEKQSQQFNYKLPTLANDTVVTEFKSNLDIKLLSQQGLVKLNNYETPAREEDYYKTFSLLNKNELSVLLKYEETETKSYHKLLIYKPLSRNPLSSLEITDLNILERMLNLKWLDAQTITLLKKQDVQIKRKLVQPHISQGLTSIENLKKIIFNYILQKRTQMNGQKTNLLPVFSVENQRIRHKVFVRNNQKLQNISMLLLENIKKKDRDDMSVQKRQNDNEQQMINEKIAQERNFIYQIKYAILCYDINDEWQFQQNDIIQKYFEKKTIKDFACININSRQSKYKVFMILTVFRTKIHLNLEKLVYLRIDISPLIGQRNKQFKLIFELSDILNLFERSFSFENSFDELILFKIIQKISKCLVYSKSQIYKNFSLPLTKINPQQVDRHQFCLINRLQIKPSYHLIPKEITKKSFLDIIQQGERVLFQGVKRILNTYAIITIGYYSQLDYYYLQIYFPFNCRRFTNTFYSSNLANLSGEYMNHIFKEKIAKSNVQDLNKSKDYFSFNKKLIKLDPSKQNQNLNQNKQIKQNTVNSQLLPSNKHIGSQNFLNPIKIQSPQIPIEEQLESSVEQKQNALSFYVDPSVFLQLIQSNQKNIITGHNFIELNIWEEIVKSVDISIDNNGEMLLTMDNYSGVMREYLIKSVLNFSGNKSGLFEVLIRFKDQKLKSDIFSSPQIQVYENEEEKLDMYVRINFFQKINSINEKILLKQILYSYYKENTSKFQNTPKLQHHNNLLNLVGLNQQENKNQAFRGEFAQTYNNQSIQNQFDSSFSSPNNMNTQSEEEAFQNFSERSFNHSDLIQVSYLLLDRIRTSIQEKQMHVMKFYQHQNEIFETGLVEDNYEVNEPIALPPVQHQLAQNITNAYLKLNQFSSGQSKVIKEQQIIAYQQNLNESRIDLVQKQQIVNNFSNQNLDNFNNSIQNAELFKQLAINSKTEIDKVVKTNAQFAVDKKIRKKIKMNNNMNINELLDSENKQFYMKTLYRGVFTVRPLQIIAIFFYKKFYVQIYNTINGKNLITDLTFSTVEHQIPYLQHMLKLELYQEIGKRIFLSFKNRLMIKSYPELIDY
ncbi:hypothetical protein TTHERM_00522120 (macronuclear) [Tetrahymena thermophila SB210]|uniref:Uncharacterized protein n=1 Tax=Tetrahymena thermophila (strain SB210) TaxID=312017 RepID=I7M131_TETTS|nr:hypothetical protein TTHERM_00522120 [Tetrahymena thermophila SB210]EAR94145.2 hypothetical protein TTHERM_00522120 [Tetrahymena thermophila SB210]|eukprot:XP_001014390.2 hypothetical protein TTHERM_00522120 [Tetrahymena thermophila SB210]